jgi:hypothetical protein
MGIQEFRNGFGAGVGVLVGEIFLFAVAQIITAVNSAPQTGSPSSSIPFATSMLVFIPILNFIQTIAVGYKGSGEFVAGFIIGDLLCLISAGGISATIPSAVVGMATAIIGVFIGIAFRSMGGQQDTVSW